MTQEIEKIWPEWKVVERIGSGAYGSVYKAVRSDHNLTSSAAIKVISIPKDASEMESLRSDGMTQDGTRTYLQGIVDDFVNEIQLMETLKGIQNIVSVEDYKVVERTGEIGWDIYIRMELLTPSTTGRAPAPSRRPRSSVWASTSARRWRSARKADHPPRHQAREHLHQRVRLLQAGRFRHRAQAVRHPGRPVHQGHL